ncbi:MAG: heavy-metal-associated domain-containing protein [Thermoplasmatota archaeon]
MGLIGKKEKIELNVTGMTCGSCAAAVTRALEDVPGVAAVRVDVAGPTRVAVKPGTTKEDLVAAIDAAGFGTA